MHIQSRSMPLSWHPGLRIVLSKGSYLTVRGGFTSGHSVLASLGSGNSHACTTMRVPQRRAAVWVSRWDMLLPLKLLVLENIAFLW